MTAAPNPAPMTLEDWFALGEDGSLRLELDRGVLIVSPRPRLAHAGAIAESIVQLRLQMPDEFRVYAEVDVVVDPREPATVRAPDVVVLRADAIEPVGPRDVVLAIEIVSPGSARLDRVVKRDEYAAAGIPHYWIIDLDGGPSAEVLSLVDGRYEGPTVTGRIEVDGALPLALDLAALG